MNLQGLEKLGKTIANFAPLLGAVIPLPGASIIGQAVARAFGGNINDPEDLANKIANDADASVKLRQIAMDEALGVERLAIDKIRLENEDRANARQRQIATNDNTPNVIAKLVIFGYMFIMVVVILLLKFSTVNNFEEKILEMTIISMSNAVMLVLAYYFGASNNK